LDSSAQIGLSSYADIEGSGAIFTSPHRKSPTDSVRLQQRIRERSEFLIEMKDYFRSPHFVWFIVIPSGLLITFMTWYDVESLPLAYMSYLGVLARYLGTNHRTMVKLILSMKF
uniref:Transmembrane protein 254 n=1 Tax=Parascaris univalens TaxID=6257 RepID=A0A915BZK8_PARUN